MVSSPRAWDESADIIIGKRPNSLYKQRPPAFSPKYIGDTLGNGLSMGGSPSQVEKGDSNLVNTSPNNTVIHKKSVGRITVNPQKMVVQRAIRRASKLMKDSTHT